jgi:hypothetical protein
MVESEKLELMRREYCGRVFSLEGTSDKYLITYIGEPNDYIRNSDENYVEAINLSCKLRENHLFEGEDEQYAPIEVLNHLTLIKDYHDLTSEEAYEAAKYEDARRKENEYIGKMMAAENTPQAVASRKKLKHLSQIPTSSRIRRKRAIC